MSIGADVRRGVGRVQHQQRHLQRREALWHRVLPTPVRRRVYRTTAARRPMSASPDGNATACWFVSLKGGVGAGRVVERKRKDGSSVVSRSLTSIGDHSVPAHASRPCCSSGSWAAWPAARSPAATPGADPVGFPVRRASPSSPPPARVRARRRPLPHRADRPDLAEHAGADDRPGGDRHHDRRRQGRTRTVARSTCRSGPTVVLNVTSDIDDEIHAHLGERRLHPGRARPVRPRRGTLRGRRARQLRGRVARARKDHRDLERPLSRSWTRPVRCSCRCTASPRAVICRCRSPSSWSGAALALIVSFVVLLFAWRHAAVRRRRGAAGARPAATRRSSRGVRLAASLRGPGAVRLGRAGRGGGSGSADQPGRSASSSCGSGSDWCRCRCCSDRSGGPRNPLRTIHAGLYRGRPGRPGRGPGPAARPARGLAGRRGAVRASPGSSWCNPTGPRWRCCGSGCWPGC